MLHLQQYLSESQQQEILQHCREIGKKSPLFRFWAGRNPGSFFLVRENQDLFFDSEIAKQETEKTTDLSF